MARYGRGKGEPKGMPVKVASTFAGVWARFRGVDRAGRPVDVSGAVVGGPDKVRRGTRLALAVLVRPYVDGQPDVLLFVDRNADCWLRDRKRDRAARARHAVAPVFGQVDLTRVDVAVTKGDPDDPATLWTITTETLTAKDFQTLEAGMLRFPDAPAGAIRGRKLAGVRRLHLPTGAFTR